MLRYRVRQKKQPRPRGDGERGVGPQHRLRRRPRRRFRPPLRLGRPGGSYGRGVRQRFRQGSDQGGFPRERRDVPTRVRGFEPRGERQTAVDAAGASGHVLGHGRRIGHPRLDEGASGERARHRLRSGGRIEGARHRAGGAAGALRDVPEHDGRPVGSSGEKRCSRSQGDVRGESGVFQHVLRRRLRRICVRRPWG